MIGRYAPSPTGELHLGNLRTALTAWLQIRLVKGTFILRMDDLDQPRVKENAAEKIIHDLKWLGLDCVLGPDKPPQGSFSGDPGFVQSQRHHHYQHAFQTLLDRGQLYPCECSRKDIAIAASAPHGRDGVLVYPGTCRPAEPYFHSSNHEQRKRKRNSHTIEPHAIDHIAWRFRVEPTEINILFFDEVMGSQSQNLYKEVGDFVIKRKDGLFAYQLANVVDDGLMGITDVVRGADLIDSTIRQIALFESLGFPTPRFWHIPLLYDEHNQPMSKRDGSQSLGQWRGDMGEKQPETMVGQLAFSMGLIDRCEALSARELLNSLTPEVFREKLIAATATT